MGLLDPIPPPYDPLDWAQKPFPERARMVCQAWALQGYGTPPATYAVYALKVATLPGVTAQSTSAQIKAAIDAATLAKSTLTAMAGGGK